ncbi:MAG: hypothetical protein ABH821_06225 [archaeon]
MINDFGGSQPTPLIIQMLSKEWPLTAKQIFLRLNKIREKKVSYQAVHKLLIQLAEKKVIEKNNTLFSLNKEWIKKTRNFANQLEVAYKSNTKFFDGDVSQGNTKIISFESLLKFDDFLFKILEDKRTACCMSYWEHLRWPMHYARQACDYFKQFEHLKNFYMLCSNNTALDKWCASTYRNLGCKIKTNVKIINHSDFLAFDDYFIQITYDKEFRNEINNFYKEAKSFSKFKITKFIDRVLEKQFDIRVLVTIDEKITNRVIDFVKSQF